MSGRCLPGLSANGGRGQIALGRRNAQRKERMPPFAYWFQQQMMRIFIPLFGARQQDWLLGYKADW